MSLWLLNLFSEHLSSLSCVSGIRVVQFLPSVKRDAGHCLSWCLLSLYCLFFLELRLLITPLISSDLSFPQIIAIFESKKDRTTQEHIPKTGMIYRTRIGQPRNISPRQECISNKDRTTQEHIPKTGMLYQTRIGQRRSMSPRQQCYIKHITYYNCKKDQRLNVIVHL